MPGPIQMTGASGNGNLNVPARILQKTFKKKAGFKYKKLKYLIFSNIFGFFLQKSRKNFEKFCEIIGAQIQNSIFSDFLIFFWRKRLSFRIGRNSEKPFKKFTISMKN